MFKSTLEIRLIYVKVRVESLNLLAKLCGLADHVGIYPSRPRK